MYTLIQQAPSAPLDAHAEAAEEEGGEEGEEPPPPSLQQLQQSQAQSQSQRRERVPSLASLGSASSWVELRENGAEALRLQVETEVGVG